MLGRLCVLSTFTSCVTKMKLFHVLVTTGQNTGIDARTRDSRFSVSPSRMMIGNTLVGSGFWFDVALLATMRAAAIALILEIEV